MSGRPERPPALCERALLSAVGDWPFARAPELRLLSGLSRPEFARAWHAAQRHGWIETGRLAGEGRLRRAALTAGGCREIGVPYSAALLTHCWLGALALDAARRLIAECAHDAEIVWSLSPFSLAAEAARAEGRADWPQLDVTRDVGLSLRRLRLAALACLRFGPESYRTVAMLADPGGLALDWFWHQFRAYHAWARRSEFTGRYRALPVLLVIAANERTRSELGALWAGAAGRRRSEAHLRLTTYAALSQPWAVRPWHDERGRVAGLWQGWATAERPAEKPVSHAGLWWAAFDSGAGPEPVPASAPSSQSPLLAWARRYWQRHGLRPTAKGRRAHLIEVQRTLTPTARAALRAVGRYPLLTTRDLAAVLAVRADHAARALHMLSELALIDAYPPAGYALSAGGLALLAGWARCEPREYALLRRWPVREQDGALYVATEAWRAEADHTRWILACLAGLRRYGPRHGLTLTVWDQWRADAARTGGKTIIFPDAVGVVRTARGECTFWLEVDRATQRGQALWAKLERYYARPAPAPRLLIVVAEGGEARLQALRRRLRALDAQQHTRLDVRLARADQLEVRPGDLDPGRPVWRTPHESAPGSPFD